MALNWCRTFAIILILSHHLLAEVLIKNENDTQSVHNSHHDHSNQQHNNNDSLDSSHASSKSDRTSLPSSTAHHLHRNNNNNINATNFLRLEDVLDIFNIADLSLKWNNVNHQFHENCSRDMHEYFNGLQMRRIWAAKSELFRFFSFFSQYFTSETLQFFDLLCMEQNLRKRKLIRFFFSFAGGQGEGTIKLMNCNCHLR